MMLNTLVALAALLGGLQRGPDPKPIADVVGAPAPRLGADQVVSKVQAFYVGTAQLKAKFRQEYTNITFGKKSISDGLVWIKKPGKMRWDYFERRRNTKSFLSDGTTLWAAEHDNKQVFKKDLENDMLPVAVTFLYGQGDLAKDFSAALDPGAYGAATDYVVKLTPRAPSAQYKNLWLVVDPSNFRVKQSIVLEASGNTNHFRFFEPDTKATVKDSWFVFNELAHPDYKVIVPKEGEDPTATP